MNFEECVEFIKERHGNQTRKQGTPYYLHPVAVANILKEKGFSVDYQIAGLFHDLLEDTETTYEEIVKISNDEIAEAVRLVTKEENYKMDDYVERISKNEMAKSVKLADRIHNLQESKYADCKWRLKYIKETESWYVDLSKNTVFEEDLNQILDQVKSITDTD